MTHEPRYSPGSIYGDRSRRTPGTSDSRFNEAGERISHVPRRKTTAEEKAARKTLYTDKPFAMFDGEGHSNPGKPRHAYILLADTTGRTLTSADRIRGLSTVECLEFLLHSDPRNCNVWYGFGYDRALILGDLSATNWAELEWHNPRRNLVVSTLRGYTISTQGEATTFFPGFGHWTETPLKTLPPTFIRYRIKTQMKRFVVLRGCGCPMKGHVPGVSNWKCPTHAASFTSYDVQPFFQTSFLKALKQYEVSYDSEILEPGKAARSTFAEWPMENLVAYNAEECRAGALLCERLRECIRGAKLKVQSWHGPGAIAGPLLRSWGCVALSQCSSTDANDLALYGYYGGRIETCLLGSAAIEAYDLKSAYPSAMRFVPDMRSIEWQSAEPVRVNKLPPYDEREFGYAYVAWRVSSKTRFRPFPVRLPESHGGQVCYPEGGAGWYHLCEVRAAMEAFPRSILIDSLMYGIRIRPYPLYDKITELYERRAELKRNGDGAQMALKLALNSLYGKLIQLQGAEYNAEGEVTKFPPLYNPHWGGFITAFTRAKILRAMAAGAKLYTIATDGIWCEPGSPVPDVGDALGQWERDEKTVRGVSSGYPGIYEEYDVDGNRFLVKNRGYGAFPTTLSLEDMFPTLRKGKPFIINEQRFITPRLAVARNDIASMGTWPTERREIKSLLRGGENHMAMGAMKRGTGKYPAKGRGLIMLQNPLKVKRVYSHPYTATIKLDKQARDAVETEGRAMPWVGEESNEA